MPKISMDDYAKQCIDTLLDTAKRLGTQSIMGQACLERANYIMDFVEAYKEYLKKP